LIPDKSAVDKTKNASLGSEESERAQLERLCPLIQPAKEHTVRVAISVNNDYVWSNCSAPMAQLNQEEIEIGAQAIAPGQPIVPNLLEFTNCFQDSKTNLAIPTVP
jgi:hypothetical protein